MTQADKTNPVATEYRQTKVTEMETKSVIAELGARQMAKLAAQDETYKSSAEAMRKDANDLADRLTKLKKITEGSGLNKDAKIAILTQHVDGNLRAILQNQELLDNADLYWSEADRDDMVKTHRNNVMTLQAAYESAREMIDEITAAK